jgi:hypothetical protein
MKFKIGDSVRFRRPVQGDEDTGTVVEATDTQIRVSFSGRRLTHLLDANNFEHAATPMNTHNAPA